MTTEGNEPGESITAGQMARKDHLAAQSGHSVAVARTTGGLADPFLDLRALAEYSNLSIRTLARHLGDHARPLPHYKVRGKILVRRSEFDAWMQGFRRSQPPAVPQLVDEVLAKFRS
jgi:helix-turn-helix protein